MKPNLDDQTALAMEQLVVSQPCVACDHLPRLQIYLLRNSSATIIQNSALTLSIISSKDVKHIQQIIR